MTEFDHQDDEPLAALPPEFLEQFAATMGRAFGTPRFVLVDLNYESRSGVVLFLRREDGDRPTSSVMACSAYEPISSETPQWVVETGLSPKEAVERAVQQAYFFDEPDIVVKLDDAALWDSAWGDLVEDCRFSDGYNSEAGLGDEIRIVVDDVYEPNEGFVILVAMYHRDLVNPELIHCEADHNVPEMLAKAEALALGTHRQVIVQLATRFDWPPEWGTLFTVEEATAPPSFRLDIGRTKN